MNPQKKIEGAYRASRILPFFLFFISILVPILSYLITTYEFGFKISVFTPFIFVHLWWFFPAEMGYLPFFSKSLRYYPRLMKKIFWVMYLWPIIIGGIIAADSLSDLSITNAIFSVIPFASGALPSIVALFTTVLPMLIKKLLSGFFNKVNIEVMELTKDRVIIMGSREKFYSSPKALQKGLPILIKNGGRNPLTVSHVVLGITTLNIPLSFKSKSGRTPIEYEEIWELPDWLIIQSKSSQILYIPWQKVNKASFKAQEITAKIGKRPRFHIGISDPFPNRLFWSRNINHQSLSAEFNHLEWRKKNPNWGKD